MGQAFTLIYGLFRRRRWLFAAFLAMLIGFTVWFGSKIRLEEDISRVIPSSEQNDKLIGVLQHSKFADRMVFCLSLDAGQPSGPDLLIEFADAITDSLKNEPAATYIRKVEDQFGTAGMRGIYDIFYQNLPLFLDEQDYTEIEGKLGDSAISLAIKKDYEALVTAGGFAMRDFILRDPLSLTPIALKKLEKLRISGDFELYGDHIMSKDRRNLLFFVIPSNPSTETSRNSEFLEIVDAFILNTEKHFQGRIKVHYFGSMAVSISNASQIKSDIILTLSIALTILLLFLGMYFRKVRSLLLLFLPAIMGGGFAIAMLSLLKNEVSA
ncbi:MAG TPA: hypothetical protein VK994_03890, partial [Bacteroidales bacterium]|nr:hypothetical protein [Bacteroidales bacterium]